MALGLKSPGSENGQIICDQVLKRTERAGEGGKCLQGLPLERKKTLVFKEQMLAR